QVRVASLVAYVHAGADVPVPVVLVPEEPGDVAAQLIRVVGAVIRQEEGALAVGALLLAEKEAQVREQGERGEIERVGEARDVPRLRILEGDIRILIRMDEGPELEPGGDVLGDEVVEARGERADDRRRGGAGRREGLEGAVHVVRGEADAPGQVRHQPAVTEGPAAAYSRAEGERRR